MLSCVLGFAYYIHKTTNVYVSWNPIVDGVAGYSHRYQHHRPSFDQTDTTKGVLVLQFATVDSLRVGVCSINVEYDR
ncbi:hypothetical protein Hanom_Chr04g00326011 [Helianthus anomalus]